MMRAVIPTLRCFGDLFRRRPPFTRLCPAVAALLAVSTLTAPAAAPPLPEAKPRPTAQLFQARTDRLALDRAREAFDAGRTIEGVSYLQQVLEGPADSFVITAEGVSGARRAAETALEELPAVSRRLYESARTAAGTAALREACEHHDLEALREISRRYPSIEPGFRAVDRLALIAFDRGDFGTAARLWCDLLEEPRHANRVTPALAARAIIALRRTGQDDLAAEVAASYEAATLHSGAGQVAELLEAPVSWSPPIASTGRSSAALPGLTPPAFPPVWRHSIGFSNSGLDELWSQSRLSEARPVATPTGAVIINDQIIVRSPAAIRAFDATTGEPVWQFPLAGASGASQEDKSQKIDLHELSQFEETYAGNAVRGDLSTDGNLLFFIDREPERLRDQRVVSRTPVPVFNQSPDGDANNRLIALRLPEDRSSLLRPAWTLGGNSAAPGSLAGHYFFGTPVVADDRLLVVTERQQRLNLVAIDPATGSIVWQQPLGFVPRPVAGDGPRAAAPARPAVGDGIAVCGTNAGFVVAVDVATGRLLWAYDYESSESSAEDGLEPPAERLANYGDPSIPSPMIVRGQTVVFLPTDSRRVHCLELESGAVRWTAPRDDALYVAGIDERAAIVAGRSHCRSLSIVSGSLLWSIRLGAPAGMGIVSDRLFLVPLESGIIAAVELATGRRVGFESPRQSQDFQPLTDDADAGASIWRPANLIANENAIYSVGAFEVTRLPTAAAVLADPPAQLSPLETARIELAAGALDAAQTKLEQIVDDSGDEPVADEAKSLLREVHYLKLPRQTETDAAATLAELDLLSQTPACRGRFLLEAVERELTFHNSAAVKTRLQELSHLQLDEPLAVPDEATHLVTVAGWMPAVLERSQLRLPEPTAVAELPSLEEDELRRLLLCRSDDAVSAQIRIELARRAIADGDYHRAEMLLLRAGKDRLAAEEAIGELALLRERCGINVSAQMLDGDTRPNARIGSVTVSGQLWQTADDRLCQAFARSRRGFATRFAEPLRIVDRGNSRDASLAIVDLQSGVCRAEFSLDARLRFPSLNRQPPAGHFVPVATVDRLYGVSILEAGNGASAWEVELPGRDGLLPQLGPYGPSFCSVQTRRELCVVDPATGGTLWRRLELPPDRGLNGDHSTGLFGDEHTLTMLDADGTSYTVYQTATGEILSRGRLPIDHQSQRRAFGRKLFFIESGETAAVAHLWDPAVGRDDWRMAFRGKLLQTATRDDLLALLLDEGRLLILDPRSGQTVVDVPLGADTADTHTIQVFADDERFYVAMYRADTARLVEGRRANYVYDTPLTMSHVQGRLIAIDRRSEEILWSRASEQRSILDPVENPLPFLVGIAKVSDRDGGNRKTMLVEVIDKQTGRTLGINDRLLPDQFLQVQCDPDADRVRIAGMTSTVVLDIARKPSSAVVIAE